MGCRQAELVLFEKKCWILQMHWVTTWSLSKLLMPWTGKHQRSIWIYYHCFWPWNNCNWNSVFISSIYNSKVGHSRTSSGKNSGIVKSWKTHFPVCDSRSLTCLISNRRLGFDLIIFDKHQYEKVKSDYLLINLPHRERNSKFQSLTAEAT